MNALVVDTSAWVSYLRGKDQDDLDLALQEGRAYLPPLVVAELFSGKMTPKQKEDLADLIRDLPICETPLEHWIRVGELRRVARDRGLSVSTPDAHVAQCAIDRDAILLAGDSIFARIASMTTLRLRS